MVWTTRKLHRLLHQVAGMVRIASCLGIISAALAVQAMQSGTTDNTSTLSTLATSVTPTYLEKIGSPLSLHQEAGYQVGGLNNNFNLQSSIGTLSLRGGMYFSHELAPRTLLDNSEPLPDRLHGENPQAATGGSMLGFTNNLLSNGAHNTVSDQITYQQLAFTQGGLSLTGGYANVGKDFKGLDALVQQMSQSDPSGAKSLELGMSRMNLGLNYTGLRGFNFSTNMATVENDQQGHKEYGLTRTTNNSSLGFALGQTKLDYSVANLVEHWDPSVATKDSREVETQALKLSGGLGQKSKFSLGQTLTGTTTGTQHTDVSQRDLSLQWAEWRNFNLQGGYSTKETEQTGERNNVLSLDMAAKLLPNVQLVGKLVDNSLLKPNGAQPATEVNNNLLDLKLTANLLANLQVSSQYQDLDTPEKGATQVRDQQLAWAFSPRWKFSTRIFNSNSEKLGENSRVEYGVTGDVGTKACPQQLSLINRSEDMLNKNHQDRTELTYSTPIPLGKSPVTIQLRAGQYGLQTADTSYDRDLLTVQVLAAKPTPDTSLSMGYYQGPTLGTSYLAYRAWGLKPQGNADTWQQQDLTDYREWGGELTHNLSKSTKLVVKQFNGDITGTGEQATTEYGFEQHFGTMALLGGQRYTSLPATGGQTDQQESWWRVNLPFTQKLPEWAANSLRFAVFSDSATWGIAQAPAWATAPVAGVTIDKRDILMNGAAARLYTFQGTAMLGRSVFLQSSYERNPAKQGTPNAIDALSRRLFHVGIQVQPKMQIFGRFISEDRLDMCSWQHTRSLGFIGQLSKTTSLQCQVDSLERRTNAILQSGIAYTFEFARTLNDDDTLVFKYRLSPSAFSTADNHVGLEMNFRRAF